MGNDIYALKKLHQAPTKLHKKKDNNMHEKTDIVTFAISTMPTLFDILDNKISSERFKLYCKNKHGTLVKSHGNGITDAEHELLYAFFDKEFLQKRKFSCLATAFSLVYDVLIYEVIARYIAFINEVPLDQAWEIMADSERGDVIQKDATDDHTLQMIAEYKNQIQDLPT